MSFNLTNPSKPVIDKSPGASLDYVFNWTDWLAEVSDTIVSYTVVVQSGLTKASDSIAAGRVTATLSGGTLGKTYFAKCTITTTGGRTDSRTIYLHIVNR